MFKVHQHTCLKVKQCQRFLLTNEECLFPKDKQEPMLFTPREIAPSALCHNLGKASAFLRMEKGFQRNLRLGFLKGKQATVEFSGATLYALSEVFL